MTEEKKDVLLRQGNPLTESRYKFTPTEKNAFLVVVKNVRKNYIEREPPRKEFESMRVKITPEDMNLIRDEDHTKEAKGHSEAFGTKLSRWRTKKETGCIAASLTKPNTSQKKGPTR